MAKKGKLLRDFEKTLDLTKTVTLREAVAILKKAPKRKFDESIDIAMNLSVDPKQADQQVRGTVTLPHGTGKSIKIAVIASDENAKAALEAGADFAGSDDLFEKIKGGWTDFDALVVTPDMMRKVGVLGKVLGPKGLMPSPKAGTVTKDVVQAVQQLKKGQIEYKVDKSGVINNQLAKSSFTEDQIVENAETLIQAIVKAKPASAKGTYIQGISLSSTMGPGIKIDTQAHATT